MQGWTYFTNLSSPCIFNLLIWRGRGELICRKKINRCPDLTIRETQAWDTTRPLIFRVRIGACSRVTVCSLFLAGGKWEGVAHTAPVQAQGWTWAGMMDALWVTSSIDRSVWNKMKEAGHMGKAQQEHIVNKQKPCLDAMYYGINYKVGPIATGYEWSQKSGSQIRKSPSRPSYNSQVCVIGIQRHLHGIQHVI